MRQDREVRRGVDRAELLERLVRPAGDDVDGVGEALARREARTRVDDVGAPVGDLGERREVRRELDGAEDDEPRRRAR